MSRERRDQESDRRYSQLLAEFAPQAGVRPAGTFAIADRRAYPKTTTTANTPNGPRLALTYPGGPSGLSSDVVEEWTNRLGAAGYNVTVMSTPDNNLSRGQRLKKWTDAISPMRGLVVASRDTECTRPPHKWSVPMLGRAAIAVEWNKPVFVDVPLADITASCPPSAMGTPAADVLTSANVVQLAPDGYVDLAIIGRRLAQ